ncbi:MAG TPA: Gldg family protein [Victivallales bacterium]|nr:Gldg family protein [Victivallales bacterium]
MKSSNQKKHKYILSFLAILAFLIILININFFIDTYVNVRVDVTKDKLYTLSSGTINILNNLKQTVTIRFYRTYNKNRMPVALRTYASRIKSLLYEYVKASNGKLILEVYDPEPDSDAEESAIIDNIQPKTLTTGEKCYIFTAVIPLEVLEVLVVQ